MLNQINASRELLHSADTVLIGAGAGLTAAAGINYTDKAKFREVFPAWVKRGFSMQYQLMGYTNWTEAEKWGYYTTHLRYVFFGQKTNALYQTLQQIVSDKDTYVMTSNVEELFHKNGFNTDKIYTPQGSYGKIQCTAPCKPDSVWEVEPFYEKMIAALDPIEQVISDETAVPKCPNCGESMFLNVRADGSFLDSPYEPQLEKFQNWLLGIKDRNIVLIEMGAGFNTPGVIRLPMESLTEQLPNAAMIRINYDHPELPDSLRKNGVSVGGDLAEFIEKLAAS